MKLPVFIFEKQGNDKKRRRAAIVAMIFLSAALLVSFMSATEQVYAEDEQIDDVRDRLNQSIEEQLEAIDLGDIEEIVSSVTENITGESFSEKVRKILNGEFSDETFFQSLADLLFDWLKGQLPLFLTIGAIAVLGGIVTDMKTSRLLSGTSETVFYAIYTLVILLTISGVCSIYGMVYGVVGDIRTFTECIMPVLITLMTALGANVSVAVYRPATAFLSSGVLQLIESVIFPLFTVSVVFTVVSNLSENVRLGKLSEFFGGLSAKIMGTVFMIFSAFLTVRGITAGISDGISFKAARFAAKNYIPIVGGFVSDGMDLFLAGTVLIKNAVGGAGLFVLFVLVVIPVIKTSVFGLLMKLTASVIEPIADKRISGFLFGLSKRLSVLNAALIAAGAMLLIIIILVIITSNTVTGV